MNFQSTPVFIFFFFINHFNILTTNHFFDNFFLYKSFVNIHNQTNLSRVKQCNFINLSAKKKAKHKQCKIDKQKITFTPVNHLSESQSFIFIFYFCLR